MRMINLFFSKIFHWVNVPQHFYLKMIKYILQVEN